MDSFTPASGLTGALLIGASAALLFVLSGRTPRTSRSAEPYGNSRLGR